MDKDKQTCNSVITPSITLEEQCHILQECHQAYLEDVICGSMSYEDFVSNFFGMSGSSDGYRNVRQMFREHQPIIEFRFKSSAFCEENAMAMLKEFEHRNSFFDRSLIDIQLKPIIPKLEKDGMLELLCQCVNTTAMFHCLMDLKTKHKVKLQSYPVSECLHKCTDDRIDSLQDDSCMP